MSRTQLELKAVQHEPQIVKCTFSDEFLAPYPTTVGFFYRKEISHEILREGLIEVLSDYHIFAGRVGKIDGEFCIDSNNQGVGFSVVHHDRELDEVIDGLSEPDLPKTLFDIIDGSPDRLSQEPVFKVQVNYFAHGGMCLGLCWNHAIGDMCSFMGLMFAWSNAVAGVRSAPPVVVRDRAEYLEKNLVDHPEAAPMFSMMTPQEVEARNLYMQSEFWDQQVVRFYFSEREIQNMQQQLVAKSNGVQHSKLGSLSAHMLAMIAKYDPVDKGRCLTLTINYRSRAGLPEMVLGNMISNAIVFCEPNMPSANVATRLKQTIDEFAKKHMNYHATLRFLEENGGLANIMNFNLAAANPVKRTVGITSWARFGIYDVNFGGEPPFYFTNYAPIPVPWLGFVIDGFHNDGLIFSISVPTQVAKDLLSEPAQTDIHQYRDPDESMPEIVQRLSWLS